MPIDRYSTPTEVLCASCARRHITHSRSRLPFANNAGYGPGSQIRESDNDLLWPAPECEGESHCEGEILAGALWHMRAGLIEALGDKEEAIALSDSLFHYMRYGRPMEYEDVLVHILLQDDDDGDLSNGTPHLYTIADAFARHTIGDFDVHITHLPLYDTEDDTEVRAVEAMLGTLYPVERDSVMLHYSVDGNAYTAVPMDGVGYQFTGQIPAQAIGTTVSYYITAADETGRRATLPEDAPNEVFTYFVGTDVTPPEITHSVPTAPTFMQDRLWLWAEVTDNIGSIDAVRAVVTVEPPDSSWSETVTLYPKDAQAFPGLYEGFLELGTLAEGATISYHLEADDGAALANSARYPAQEELELTARPGRAWDFETHIDDLTMNGDWEWGVTHVDPAPAPSGSCLVGTVLDGVHGIDGASELTTPAFDLSTWERARLEFRTWYFTEDEWDGGRLLASNDGGQSWMPLTPAGGYPSWIRETEFGTFQQLPAFAGEDGVWRDIEVPLDFFVGDTIQIQFRYWSDESSVRLGWYLDDIKVVALQALVPVDVLTSTAGEDTQVSLAWAPPVGVDLESGEFLGYRVYRCDDPDGIYGWDEDEEGAEGEGEDLLPDMEPITTEPLTELTYIDTDVTNGTPYLYTVTAVYSSGESPFGPIAAGYPYQALIDAASTYEIDAEGVTALTDSLEIHNAGTGELHAGFYLGHPDNSWNDLVPTHFFDGIDDDAFTLLADDGSGAPAPDLEELWVRELNSNLSVRVTMHDSLPNPYTDCTVIVYLDTDQSRATGMPFGNVGADYFVAMGALVYQQAGTLAFIMRAVDAETVFPLALPTHLILQEGLDSLEVGMFLDQIGNPEEIGFAAQVMLPPIFPGAGEPGIGGAGARDPGAVSGTLDKEGWEQLPQALIEALGGEAGTRDARATSQGSFTRAAADDPLFGDIMPDAIDIPWLAIDPPGAIARPDEPLNLKLAFDFTSLDVGDHSAKVFVRSNDQDTPLHEIAVTAHLWYLPAEELSIWATCCREDGILLEWCPCQPDSFDAFLLCRWDELECAEDAVPLGGGPIYAQQDTLYQFLDRGVQSGRRYYYQLSGITARGDTLEFAPPAFPLYDPPSVVRLAIEAPRPNPFRTTAAFRIHAPEGSSYEMFVVDVGGRLVRQLVRKSESQSGVQLVTWDGRSEAGNAVAQGIYYAVIRGGGKQATRSMVLIR